jgi:hypothetical protein
MRECEPCADPWATLPELLDEAARFKRDQRPPDCPAVHSQHGGHRALRRPGHFALRVEVLGQRHRDGGFAEGRAWIGGDDVVQPGKPFADVHDRVSRAVARVTRIATSAASSATLAAARSPSRRASAASVNRSRNRAGGVVEILTCICTRSYASALEPMRSVA